MESNEIYIQGASSEIEKELDVFIEELNTILSNDNQFNCEKVTDNYGVHMVNSTAEEFLNIYPEYENNGIELEDFWDMLVGVRSRRVYKRRKSFK